MARPDAVLDKAQKHRMLRETVPPNFLDSSLEWRRIFSEIWGTFLLVVVAAGAPVVSAKSGGAVALGMAVVAPGPMVMIIIYFMGTVSRAHLNLAITLACAVRRNFPRHRVPGYMVGHLFEWILKASALGPERLLRRRFLRIVLFLLRPIRNIRGTPLATVALLVGMTAAYAGPPFFTDDPVPTPLGQWEVYGFSAATEVDGDTSGTLIGTEINNGAAPGLMLHIVIPMAFDAASGHGMRAGAGDIELGAKYRFVDAGEPDWWPQIATFPLVEVPVGNARHGLGGGRFREYIPIWMQKDFGRWTTYGGGGYWINPGPGNKNYWFVGWLLQRQVTDHLALAGELFHTTADTVSARDSTGFNLGGQYDFNDHYHLLFSAGEGLQNAADSNKFSYYFGLQWTG